MSKRLTDEELRAIRERAEKATLAPWEIADTTDGAWLVDDGGNIIAGTFERIEDAIFSAHAREDIPKLLAEIERLQTQNLNLLEWNRYYLAENKRLITEAIANERK